MAFCGRRYGSLFSECWVGMNTFLSYFGQSTCCCNYMCLLFGNLLFTESFSSSSGLCAEKLDSSVLHSACVFIEGPTTYYSIWTFTYFWLFINFQKKKKKHLGFLQFISLVSSQTVSHKELHHRAWYSRFLQSSLNISKLLIFNSTLCCSPSFPGIWSLKDTPQIWFFCPSLLSFFILSVLYTHTSCSTQLKHAQRVCMATPGNCRNMQTFHANNGAVRGEIYLYSLHSHAILWST